MRKAFVGDPQEHPRCVSIGTTSSRTVNFCKRSRSQECKVVEQLRVEGGNGKGACNVEADLASRRPIMINSTMLTTRAKARVGMSNRISIILRTLKWITLVYKNKGRTKWCLSINASNNAPADEWCPLFFDKFFRGQARENPNAIVATKTRCGMQVQYFHE